MPNKIYTYKADLSTAKDNAPYIAEVAYTINSGKNVKDTHLRITLEGSAPNNKSRSESIPQFDEACSNILINLVKALPASQIRMGKRIVSPCGDLDMDLVYDPLTEHHTTLSYVNDITIPLDGKKPAELLETLTAAITNAGFVLESEFKQAQSQKSVQMFLRKNPEFKNTLQTILQDIPASKRDQAINSIAAAAIQVR